MESVLYTMAGDLNCHTKGNERWHWCQLNRVPLQLLSHLLPLVLLVHVHLRVGGSFLSRRRWRPLLLPLLRGTLVHLLPQWEGEDKVNHMKQSGGKKLLPIHSLQDKVVDQKEAH